MLGDTRSLDTLPGIGELLARMRLDPPLFLLLLLLMGVGLSVLFSASEQNQAVINSQLTRLGIGLLVMITLAQFPPDWFRVGAPWVYTAGIIMLILVLLIGDTSKGAQRWLDLGVVRFQPSEFMKLAVPLTLAAYLHQRPLPPRFKHLLWAALLLALPTALVAKQPDLGTSLLVATAGLFVVYLGGLRWRLIFAGIAAAVAAAPLLWMNMHAYQQERVLTFLNPARDPAGAGYHITQSKIAIGSGGLFGKGWLNGSQAQLQFLPESSTDFIFAVYAEEAGLLGVLLLLVLYGLIVVRCLMIAVRAQDMFQRLTAGSLGLTFFVYVFVNIGMVIGILPVVGVPLPLVSYGGTSIVILLAGFGILMSIHGHRKLLTS